MGIMLILLKILYGLLLLALLPGFIFSICFVICVSGMILECCIEEIEKYLNKKKKKEEVIEVKDMREFFYKI